jgi:hypothetical protein
MTIQMVPFPPRVTLTGAMDPLPTFQGLGQYPPGWIHATGIGQEDPRTKANTLKATLPALLVLASVLGILWYGRRYG